MKKKNVILFSGGAEGAEAEFGANAERLGIEEVNFTFEGHGIVRKRGLRVLNHEELKNGDVSLAYVSKLMNRRYTESPTLRKVLQSIWYQINNGQEIYVVGEILAGQDRQGGHGLGRRVCQDLQQAAVRVRSEAQRLVPLEPGGVGRTGEGRRARHHPSPFRGNGDALSRRERQEGDQRSSSSEPSPDCKGYLCTYPEARRRPVRPWVCHSQGRAAVQGRSRTAVMTLLRRRPAPPSSRGAGALSGSRG